MVSNPSSSDCNPAVGSSRDLLAMSINSDAILMETGAFLPINFDCLTSNGFNSDEDVKKANSSLLILAASIITRRA